MKYIIKVNGRSVEEMEDMLQQREIYEYCRKKKARLIGIDIHHNETIYRFETERGDKYSKT